MARSASRGSPEPPDDESSTTDPDDDQTPRNGSGRATGGKGRSFVDENRDQWAHVSERLDTLSMNLGDMAKSLMGHLTDQHSAAHARGRASSSAGREYDEYEDEEYENDDAREETESSDQAASAQARHVPRQATSSGRQPRGGRDSAPTIEHWYWRPRWGRGKRD